MNFFLLSVYCGLVNKYCQLSFGHNFFEMQTQGSFGSIRPSITDTGDSFRVSPGVVPSAYATVLVMAAKELTDHLCKYKEKIFKASVSYSNKKPSVGVSCLNELKSHSRRNYLAQIFIVEKLPGEGIVDVLSQICNSEKGSLTLQIKNIETEIAEIENSSTSLSTVNDPIDEFLAPQVLRDCVERTIDLASEKLAIGSSNKILTSSSPVLLLAYVIEQYQNQSFKSYALTASVFETMMRLLQILEEFEILQQYQRCQMPVLEQGVSQSEEDEVVITEEPRPGLNTFNLSGRPRSISVSSTTTNEEGDETRYSTKTYLTRSGMAALSIIICAISKAVGNKYIFTLAADEVYFEINNKYINAALGLPEGEQANILWGEKENPVLRVTDLAAFPTLAEESTQRCPWLNSAHWLQESEDQTGVPCMFVFASNNKYGQGGVDLTCIGELRLFVKNDLSNESDRKLTTALTQRVDAEIEIRNQTTVAMKAYRRVLQKMGLLRSSMPEG